MAIKSFENETTSDIYYGINSKAARRIPQDTWKPARRKMDLLHNARTTADLTLPGLRFEPLKYDRPGFNSIRVNDRYRIVFRFENGDAFDVSVENFHGKNQS